MQDVACALGPNEWLGVFVVMIDVFIDRGPQFGHAGEHAPTEPIRGACSRASSSGRAPSSGVNRVGSCPAPVPGFFHHSTVPAHARVVTCTDPRCLRVSPRTKWGFKPWACQWRITVLGLTPIWAAILRVLQCVAASGVVWVVNSACCSGVNTIWGATRTGSHSSHQNESKKQELLSL